MPRRATKRRKRKPNILQVRIEALSVPARMKPETYLKTLLNVLGGRQEMPENLDVELHWRNPNTRQGRTKQWQSGEYTEVLTDSSSGFSSVVRRAIEGQLKKVRRGK